MRTKKGRTRDSKLLPEPLQLDQTIRWGKLPPLLSFDCSILYVPVGPLLLDTAVPDQIFFVFQSAYTRPCHNYPSIAVMPRRRAKELVSGQDSSLKRQKTGRKASNKVDGTGLSVSTLAASEDFDRSSRALSKSNRHLDFDGMSKLDSSSTDSMSKDLKSVADSVFKHDTSPNTDCMSKDVKSSTGGTSKGPNSVTDSVPKGGTSPTDCMSKDAESSTDNATPNKGGKSIVDDSSLATIEHDKHRADPVYYAAKYSAGLGYEKLLAWEHLTNVCYQPVRLEVHWWLKMLATYIQRSAMHSFKFASWEALGTDTQEKLSSWSVNAKGMLESVLHQRYLYEAWIWHILDDNLFSCKGTQKISKNELWESYHRLQEALSVPAQSKYGVCDSGEKRGALTAGETRMP